MFKISSRSQMKQRAIRSKRPLGELQTNQINMTEHSSQSPMSPGVGATNSMLLETPTSGVQSRKLPNAVSHNLSKLDSASDIQRSNSLNPNMSPNKSAGRAGELDDDEDIDQIMIDKGPLSATNRKSKKIKV